MWHTFSQLELPWSVFYVPPESWHHRVLLDDVHLRAHHVSTEVSRSGRRQDREDSDRELRNVALAVGHGLGGWLVDSSEVQRCSRLRRAPGHWRAAPAR
eukprot:1223455-Prymnesium_polylepis.1